MAAIFMQPIGEDISPRVYEVFKKKGLKEFIRLELGGFQILLYRKLLHDSYQYIKGEQYELIAVGTCLYKGNTYRENLSNIFKDLENGDLDYNATSGTYFLLYWDGKTLRFCTDKFGTQNIYYDKNSKVISTSFLATLVSSRDKKSLNINAITEILLTGSLIGPDTIVSEIFRYEQGLGVNLPGLQRLAYCLNPITIKEQRLSYNKMVRYQVSNIDSYFDKHKEVFEELGVLSGLTGGFDSRLLYFCSKKHLKNLLAFSTLRDVQTSEFRCAREVSRAFQDELTILRHDSLLSTTYLDVRQLSDNFYFNDGLVRTHQIWLEEIKSRDYLVRLYAGQKIGFSGIGGEQYRNSESLRKKRYRIDSLIWNEFVVKHVGNRAVKHGYREQVVLYISDKIRKLLGLSTNTQYLDYCLIKRYYNEIWNPANRTIRNNIENQMVFYVSPFADPTISEGAYQAVGYVQLGFQFEIDMINSVFPQMSGLKTDYGFSLDQKIPAAYKVNPYIKSILGLSLYNTAYNIIKRPKHPQAIRLYSVHPWLKKYDEVFENLNLPLRKNTIMASDYLYPLAIEMGFFVEEMSEYLKFS